MIRHNGGNTAVKKRAVDSVWIADSVRRIVRCRNGWVGAMRIEEIDDVSLD
jgi:hypothetical protein